MFFRFLPRVPPMVKTQKTWVFTGNLTLTDNEMPSPGCILNTFHSTTESTFFRQIRRLNLIYSSSAKFGQVRPFFGQLRPHFSKTPLNFGLAEKWPNLAVLGERLVQTQFTYCILTHSSGPSGTNNSRQK